MFAAASKTLEQLFSKPFRSVLFKSLGLTIALFIILIIAIVNLAGWLLVLPGWMETAVQFAGGLVLVLASIFLLAPITSLVAGLYLDAIAGEVERKHYAGDAPGAELPVARAMGVALKFGLIVIGVNLLVVLLFPFFLLIGIGLITVFFVANGYLLGREYFELAGLRHLPYQQVRTMRKANSFKVFLAGLLIAGIVAVPVLNLIAPMFATAFMVHVFKQVQAADARRRAAMA